MRKKVIIGNWKMHKTNAEAQAFVKEFYPFAKECSTKGVVAGLAVPYLFLADLKKQAPDLLIGAQNCHYEEKGAFTGEVSIPMLKECAVDLVLVGHSERRQYYGENNDSCNKKLYALLANKMTPLYCVGESLKQYLAKESKKVVEQQLKEGLKDIGVDDVSKIIIAYEPIWSIGTGKNASKEIAEDICSFIRQTIAKLYNQVVADKIIIQYGGSVKVENAREYLSCPNIDGVLVGGASLKVESFKALISATF